MSRLIGILTVFALVLALAVSQTRALPAVPPADAGETTEDVIPGLVKVESWGELAKLLEAHQRQSYLMKKELAVGTADTASARTAANAAAEAPAPGYQATDGADFSGTNVQVQGVDEADVVKTDGEYIYQVNQGRVLVTRAYPPEAMAVKAVLSFDDPAFQPQELYLDAEHLLVVGSTRADYRAAESREFCPPYPYLFRETVKVIVFDITDKNRIAKTREVEVDGRYLSSRKIGKSVYLLANKYPDYYILREMNLPAQDGLTPAYRDTLTGQSFKRLSYSAIHCFPDFIEPNYLVAAALSLDGPKQEVEVKAYLGASDKVYASMSNLYVAAPERHYYGPVPLRATPEEPTARISASIAPPRQDSQTLVYKFALNEGRIAYRAKGEVPGRILNQFSMDEHEGYFRVATTINDWAAGGPRNSLYILNAEMTMAGKIEDIAPGEQIYSARFMGDRGYMVTFKNTDPLYVFDLSDPLKPKILGALKIPGFSNYLHPYDENHLIGIGKDSIDMVEKAPDGRTISTGFAYYQGMKISLFDISDVTNPVEKFAVHIGDRGTTSEVLHNHKALLFSREKNLLALPITVAEHQGTPTQPWEQGTFTFQGAYVYELTAEKGFVLKGRITHRTNEDYLKAGYDWYNHDRDVERVLYIGENLYTLSNGMIKAHNLTSMVQRGSLELP